jgi:Transglycosylase SLT domain/SPOR domain
MRLRAALFALVATSGLAVAEPSAPATETVHEALCRLIDTAAQDYGVEADFLTNLIWRESSFRAHVVSPKGAQGIAQFMPGTAAERGLADPFDPEQAIPQAARLIADLSVRFGNPGLAAAAYNGGPTRVAKWLAGEGGLPAETRTYVLRVTGLAVDEWAAIARGQKPAPAVRAPALTCAGIVATLRRPGRRPETAPEGIEEAPFAPWGVQLAGNFSKAVALASFSRARQRYAGVLGETLPMVIGTRLRSRGTRTFYRVRVPAESRPAADALCVSIRKVGGACVVLRS